MAPLNGESEWPQGAYDAWGSLRVRNTFLEVDLDEQETWQSFLAFVADFSSVMALYFVSMSDLSYVVGYCE